MSHDGTYPTMSYFKNALTQIALAVATILIFLIDKSLRCKGYRWTSRWLLLTSPNPSYSSDNIVIARQTARLIDRAARRLDATCLRRSLALWWWLRWKGFPSDIRIGVNFTDGHAWVVHHDKVINDSEEVVGRYVVLDPAVMSPAQVAKL